MDSCLDPDSGRPAPLCYLEAIGVDLATEVDLVVATHWHDDHVRGAAEVLRRATGARLACSAALNSRDFQTLLGASRTAHVAPSGLDEFVDIINVIGARTTKGNAPRVWAKADTCLLRTSAATIHALSPADATMTLAFREIGGLIPVEGQPKRRAVAQRPNELSVALWVEMDEARALLGADLERGRNAGSGWQAILGSTTRPPGLAKIFKVPHHGSPTADEPRVWSDLLHAAPSAVVAGFSAGKRPLPAAADLAALAQRTPALYCVGPRHGRKIKGAEPVVRRIVRRVAPDLREADGRLGMVRLRMRANGGSEVSAELFGVAEHVRAAGG